MREVSDALDRPVGGVLIRLAMVGCDARRPGRRRDDPDESPVEGSTRSGGAGPPDLDERDELDGDPSLDRARA